MISPADLPNVSWECVHFALAGHMPDVRDKLKETPNLLVVERDVSSVTSDSELLAAISSALQFPDYFGNNWDAMDECLSDLEWLPAKGYVLILWGSTSLWKIAPYTGGKFVSVWQAAAQQWSLDNVPFHLIFVLD